MQSKVLLMPVYLATYFKVAISISVQNEHENFVNI